MWSHGEGDVKSQTEQLEWNSSYFRAKQYLVSSAVIAITVSNSRVPGWLSQVALMVKNLPASAGDTGKLSWIHGSGRSPGEGNGNLLQYSCLGNSMDSGVWRAPVLGVAKGRI